MIDGRHVDCAQHPVGHIRRTRDLQEMPARMNCHTHSLCLFCIQFTAITALIVYKKFYATTRKCGKFIQMESEWSLRQSIGTCRPRGVSTVPEAAVITRETRF